MGNVKTRRLLDASFSVLPHDIDSAKCRKAEAMGALPGPPERMARACEQVVICTGTCDPLRIAILAAGCGPLRFLEAPVSGTSGQV